MRIAQLYHDFSQRGGAEKHVEALSASLSELGHDVTVVSSTPPQGVRGFVTSFARWAIPVSGLRLARWLRRERIQVVHAHSRISALAASIALRLYRIPMVVTSHILPKGSCRLSQWGDLTICVSDAVRRCLIDKYGVAPAQTLVIHNGIEAESDPPPIRLGPEPVISLVARFTPGKGHQTFLEAANRLLDEGFPGTFVLAGDGPLEPSLREHFCSDRIRFLGHRNDVPAILASSAASVICSDSEAFPYALLESLAVGTPVVSTDCGGPAEVIQSGHNGYLYPVSDTESLQRLLMAVTGLDSSLAPRAQIAEECRTRYSRGGMVQATLAAYRRVCLEVDA